MIERSSCLCSSYFRRGGPLHRLQYGLPVHSDLNVVFRSELTPISQNYVEERGSIAGILLPLTTNRGEDRKWSPVGWTPRAPLREASAQWTNTMLLRRRNFSWGVRTIRGSIFYRLSVENLGLSLLSPPRWVCVLAIFISNCVVFSLSCMNWMESDHAWSLSVTCGQSSELKSVRWKTLRVQFRTTKCSFRVQLSAKQGKVVGDSITSSTQVLCTFPES